MISLLKTSATLIAGTAGPKVLTFAAEGLESLSAPVTVTHGDPAVMIATTATAQLAAPNANVGVVPGVRVTDADGNPVAGASVMFSATVSGRTSMKCWCTMPSPRASASAGDRKRTGFPNRRIVPPSGAWSPNSTFMSVVLPAPFSPTSAWIVPGATRSVTPSFARRRPKTLVMPSSSTAGVGWASVTRSAA